MFKLIYMKLIDSRKFNNVFFPIFRLCFQLQNRLKLMSNIMSFCSISQKYCSCYIAILLFSKVVSLFDFSSSEYQNQHVLCFTLSMLSQLKIDKSCDSHFKGLPRLKLTSSFIFLFQYLPLLRLTSPISKSVSQSCSGLCLVASASTPSSRAAA